MEVSRAFPWCWCPRAGLGLQPGLVGTAFAFPSQRRLRQGPVSACPTSPPPDQALEQSRCCPHTCEQGRGECWGRKRFRLATRLGPRTPTTVRQRRESVPVCRAANIYLYCC